MRLLPRQAHRPSASGDVTDGASDVILIGMAAIAAIVMTGTWLTGQIAALTFHGEWPPVSIGQALHAAWTLPSHLSDPRQAWPASVRGELPGLFAFLGAGIVATAIVAGMMTALG